MVVLPVLCVAIASVLARAVDHPDTRAVRALAVRPLLVCGALSYALYLYNEAVWVVLAQHRESSAITALVGIPVTFALALASRVLVERPALRLKQRFEPRAAAL